MIVHDFTEPELAFYREFCNFTTTERELYELRAAGHTLDECCELLNMDLSSIKRLSCRVNSKIIRVTKAVNMQRWIKQNFFDI